MKAILFCSNCGQEIKNDVALYCGTCGEEIKKKAIIAMPQDEMDMFDSIQINNTPVTLKSSEYLEIKWFVEVGSLFTFGGVIMILIAILLFNSGYIYGILLGIIGSAYFLIPGYILFIKGFEERLRGIVLILTGIASTVIFILFTFVPLNSGPYLIFPRIIIDIIGELTIYLIFIVSGTLQYIQEDKPKNIFIALTWIYFIIRCSIPIFLFFPLEWFLLSIIIIVNIGIFWFLAFGATRLISKYINGEYRSGLHHLNAFAMIIYIVFFLTMTIMYVISPDMNFYNFYFAAYGESLKISFFIALGVMFVYWLAREYFLE